MSEKFDDLVGFPERVKAKRQALNLKQDDLSSQLGYAPSYISQIETGKRSPSLTSLIALADILNVSIDYLLLGSERSVYDNYDIVGQKLSPIERENVATAIQSLIQHRLKDE